MDKNTTLSIFVDESGNLPIADNASRFYIVSLVAHNQQKSEKGVSPFDTLPGGRRERRLLKTRHQRPFRHAATAAVPNFQVVHVVVLFLR